MTLQEAITHYERCIGLTEGTINESNLPYHEDCCHAVNALQSVAAMVERQDGVLRSRQVIASVIHSTLELHKLRNLL
jgi:hypothetical protein